MSTMDAARIAYLQDALDSEYISTGELQEIESAFAELDSVWHFPDNASASDMLDELYAYGVTMGRARERAAFADLLEAEDDES